MGTHRPLRGRVEVRRLRRMRPDLEGGGILSRAGRRAASSSDLVRASVRLAIIARMHRLNGTPASGAGVAVLATSALLTALLFARLILANGQEAFLGQSLDPFASAMVLTSLLFGLWLARRPLPIRIPDATNLRLLGISVGAFALLALGTFWVFGTSPATPDEQAALFQARLFSEFKVIGQYPAGLVDEMLWPLYRASASTIVLVGGDGRAMSVYWPGWALLMTPFVWLGAPWLLGPAMGGLSAFMTGKLASLLGGPRAGTLAVILALTSGAFILNGMSLYPAGGHLALSLLFAWLILRGGKRDYVLAGLVGGYALIMNNPFPHMAFATPWLLWILVDPKRRGRLIPLAIGYVPGLLVLVGWLLLQGSVRLHDSTAASSVWVRSLPLLLSVPSPTILAYRFLELVRLWAWSAPGLLAVAWIAWRRTREQMGLRLLGASFVLTVALYCLFPSSQGLGYGARYYHVAWGALPILAAVLLVSAGWDRLRSLMLASAFIGLALVVPLEVTYGRGLAEISAIPVNQLRGPGVDLVFLDFEKERCPGLTLNNNPSTEGFLVLISHGPKADQTIVDRYFPGARLVTQTSFGSGYARP
jgi:hypothetical protein